MATALAPTGTIEVRARFFPLAFILLLCRPKIVIDGAEPVQRGWGISEFPIAPGRHTVTVYFRYLFLSRCGENTREIDVPAGQTVRVSFYMPPFIFAKGMMSVDAPRSQLPRATVV